MEAAREQQAEVRGETDDIFIRIGAVQHSYSNNKRTTNCVPSQQDSNKKGCTRCSTYPSAWLMKLHAVSVKSKATISQCIDQSQI